MITKIIILLLAIGFLPVIVASPEIITNENEEVKTSLSWVINVPNHIDYFKPLEKTIINSIGLNSFLLLIDKYGQRGVHFGFDTLDKNSKDIKEFIGEINYHRLHDLFSGRKGVYLYFRSMAPLKKAWLKLNPDIHYGTAANLMGVSAMTIYRWKKQIEKSL